MNTDHFMILHPLKSSVCHVSVQYAKYLMETYGSSMLKFPQSMSSLNWNIIEPFKNKVVILLYIDI